MRTTLALLLAPLLLLFVVLPARADESLDAARTSLEAVLTAPNEPLQRGRRVKTLLSIDTEDAAKVALQLLPAFAESQAKREKAAHDVRERYEPYTGRSFKDPGAWDIKKRLQGLGYID